MAIKSLREQYNESAKGLNMYQTLSGKGPRFEIEPAPPRKPKAATDVPTEWSEQVAFVQWFRAQFPGVVIFAIPNGGARDAVTAGRLKREGVLPGVPDLYVPAWKCWIEMKRCTGGRQSPEQKDMESYLLGCGDTYLLCKGCDDAIAQVRLFVKYREMRGIDGNAKP